MRPCYLAVSLVHGKRDPGDGPPLQGAEQTTDDAARALSRLDALFGSHADERMLYWPAIAHDDQPSALLTSSAESSEIIALLCVVGAIPFARPVSSGGAQSR